MPEPEFTIVVTTWAPNNEEGRLRENAAREAILSWRQYLPLANLHIADDGSSLPDYPKSLESCWGRPVTFTSQQRRGVGASLNAGLRQAFELTPVVLYAVDDWLLGGDYPLQGWIELLKANEDVAMVRLGPPHPWLTGTVEMFREGWGLRLDRHHFAFGHRPALYHKRLIDAYGWFDEGINALECERLYNERFCQTVGPDIILALPTPWEPILSSPEFGDVTPDGGLSDG